jgi:hypothetical protein
MLDMVRSCLTVVFQESRLQAGDVHKRYDVPLFSHFGGFRNPAFRRCGLRPPEGGIPELSISLTIKGTVSQFTSPID